MSIVLGNLRLGTHRERWRDEIILSWNLNVVGSRCLQTADCDPHVSLWFATPSVLHRSSLSLLLYESEACWKPINTLLCIILFNQLHTSPVWVNVPLCVYCKLLHLPLSAITPVWSSYHPLVCWLSVNKDVLYEFHWLFKLLSRSCNKFVNDGYDSLSEGNRTERKMEKLFISVLANKSRFRKLWLCFLIREGTKYLDLFLADGHKMQKCYKF